MASVNEESIRTQRPYVHCVFAYSGWIDYLVKLFTNSRQQGIDEC